MGEGRESALGIRFWGVRGSYPVPGPSTVLFGGNTPCVEIRVGQRLFIVDAGTGIVPLGRTLCGAMPSRIDILFSHLHLDHVLGLAFFAPAFSPLTRIVTHCGNLDGQSAEEPLGRLFSPPLFPVSLDGFTASFEHRGFRSGETLRFEDGIQVSTLPLKHPAGATAYRFDHGGRSICYVSDVEHSAPWPPAALVAFVAGADLVVFDAMFTEGEYPRCRGWGHSTLESGLALCEAAGARAIAAFHHNTCHDDATLLAREAELAARRPGSFFAREGQSLTFDPVAASPKADPPALEADLATAGAAR